MSVHDGSNLAYYRVQPDAQDGYTRSPSLVRRKYIVSCLHSSRVLRALVAIPALFIEDVIVTDLTSIGTLFAFALVAGGVLLLPRVAKQPGRFSLPYWNGQYAVPLIVAAFIAAFNKRITDAVVNISHDSYQEILFLVFVAVAIGLAILSFVKKFSSIDDNAPWTLRALMAMYM